MRALFSLQYFPGSVQNDEFCRMFRNQFSDCGHDLVWLFRGKKPDGRGLFLDVDPRIYSEETRLTPNAFEKWVQRVSGRYSLSLESAGRVVQSVESQYRFILESGYFDTFWAWNTSEPIAGIGREVAIEMKIPVFSLETGLFRGNYRLDRGHFYDDDNALPLDLAEYEGHGSDVLEYMSRSGMKIHSDLKKPSATNYYKRSKSKLNILFLDGLVYDNGEFPFERYEDSSLVYGERGMVGLAEASSRDNELNVRLRLHPLANNRSYANRFNIRSKILANRGSLDDLIESSDLIVVGSSKTVYQGILSRKPTLILGEGFFYGQMASVLAAGCSLADFYKSFVAGYDVDESLAELSRVVGYLHAKRWPTAEGGGVPGYSFECAIADAHLGLKPQVDPLCGFECLLEKSHAQLEDSRSMLRREVSLSRGRLEALKSIFIRRKNRLVSSN